MTFTIGGDPELALAKGNTYVSADGLDGPVIPGTKKNPYEVRGGAIQVDGTSVEFNINPASDFKTYYGNLKSVLLELKKRIKAKDPELVLVPKPSVDFDPAYFDALPDTAKELGCDPDFDAYRDGAPNPRPNRIGSWSSCGGHIHVGFGKDYWKENPFDRANMLDNMLFVKAMDKYHGHASKDWDKDERRRRLYGNPGAFRPKKFGSEYRTPSNAFLGSSKSIQSTFLITMGVLRGLEAGTLDLEPKFRTRDAGNNAEEVLDRLGGYIYDLY